MKKQARYTPDTSIKGSAQAAGFLREDLRALDHEESWILLLNSANLPLAKKMITVGTIKSTPVDHRRIIKEALLCNATAIILFHNHPSGNPAPEEQDRIFAGLQGAQRVLPVRALLLSRARVELPVTVRRISRAELSWRLILSVLIDLFGQVGKRSGTGHELILDGQQLRAEALRLKQ